MSYGEADTRAKLIDPALHACGWTEDLIRREETAGAIEIIEGKPRKRSKGRVDYMLRVKVNPDTQPVAVALIEAKAEDLPPTHGLEQAKLYAGCKRLNVPLVFSSNGHLFVEYDRFTGKTFTAGHLLTDLAAWGQLRRSQFVCDGEELRSEGLDTFQNVFGAEATEVYREPDGTTHARNACVHIATYQTLDVDSEDGTE